MDNSESIQDLCTDAIAEPPRHSKNQPVNTPVINDTQSQSNASNNEFINKERNRKKYYYDKFESKRHHIPDGKFGNVINVVNCSNTRVGHDYNVYPNYTEKFKSENSKVDDEDVPLTDEIVKLLASNEILKRQHIDLISLHIGHKWKFLGKKLGFSTGELEQLYDDNKEHKLKEVIFKMLLQWSQRQLKTPTISQIIQILWNCDFKEVVQIFSRTRFENDIQ